MENLIELRAKRGCHRASLTRMRKFVLGLDEFNEKVIAEIRVRLYRLEQISQQFDEVQTRIEIITGSESSEEIEVREEFESIYFSLYAEMETLINKHNHTLTAPKNESQASGSTRWKLPKLQLPTFNGEYSNWITFRDMFITLVDHNKELSDIEKLHYLKESLTGGAASYARTIILASNSYEIVFKGLCDRYNNKKLLIHHHIKNIVEGPRIKQECPQALRRLSDDIKGNLQFLQGLGINTGNWDPIILYLVLEKLDLVTRREWETHMATVEDPNLQEFHIFISQRCQLIETLQKVNGTNKVPHEKTRPTERKSIALINSISPKDCPNCHKAHQIFQCDNFKGLPIHAKHQLLDKLKICYNCLRPGHLAKTCVASGCRKCGKKHNTLIHQESSELSKGEKTQEKQPSLLSATTIHNPHILLSTALVHVISGDQKHVARVLLDSGSQGNFITQNLAMKMKAPLQRQHRSISGFNQQRSNISHSLKLEIQSTISNFRVSETFMITEKISDTLPQSQVNISSLQLPQNIRLADPGFANPGQIDMLLGATVFWKLLSVGQIKLNQGKIIIQKTRLGWVVSGTIPAQQSQKKRNKQTYTFLALSNQLERFWEIEELPHHSPSSTSSTFEKHFVKTLVRQANGHFQVDLPFKNPPSILGESYTQALKRYTHLEQKLKRSPQIREFYEQFMSEYEKLGHMTKILDNHPSNIPVYYLPHHGVLKETSATTKLRVVFDGSAKSSNGVSLNDILENGPVLQDDLFSILLRFRKYPIVITSDIEKMYRQIYINPQHRNLQRILWRPTGSNSIHKYQLNTITYGTTSGSSLAIRCLHEVANQIESFSPNLSRIIKQDFYVDDLLTGGETKEEVLEIQSSITKILKEYGFPLRKWNSNNTEVIQEIRKDKDIELKHLVIEDSATKTLGLWWDANSDYIHYHKLTPLSKSPTKRSVLSTIAKIFDPLGLIAPVVISLKILMQELWVAQLDWDESLPLNLHTKWRAFQEDCHYFSRIRVPRHIAVSNSIKWVLHGFSDASQTAYGACIYIVTTSEDNQVQSRLMCSKSKVAPLKTISIPRLELCAALLLSQLVKKVTDALKINFHKQYLWTDSQITLAWLAKEPHTWNIFVANRVAKIHSLTTGTVWKHVSSNDNPADIVSRGATARDLHNKNQWWNGPKWLTQPEEFWGHHSVLEEMKDIPEQRRTSQSITLLAINKDHIWDRYSSFSRFQRIVAYMRRFAHNCRRNTTKHQGPLSTSELQAATTTIVKLVQAEEYQNELKHLQQSKSLPRTSKILHLNPILDQEGVLRVGGRIRHSNVSFEARHPSIIPGNHKVAELLIQQFHRQQLHIGIQAILYALRQHYWITGGIARVKSVIRKCHVCFRVRPSSYTHLMGDLPQARVQPVHPFYSCGVDYAGPIEIRNSILRGSKTTKAYICIFVCFSTKAVHIELVSNLTTEAFINALKRFISRRGKPVNIYSDNGRTFVGAFREIKQLEKSMEVNNYITTQNISWHFIPPKSPHFGGLWEAAVKSAKTTLRKIVGDTILTYEEMHTVLVQIEACLNSRPLSPISNDPDDLLPLTPSHFLILRTIEDVPTADVSNISNNRLSRYQMLHRIVQQFWKRWSKEYLHHLQARKIWKSSTNRPKEGDLVLLADKAVPPLQWRLGRISRLYPGKDGVVRVAEVKTANGQYVRSIQQLCPLPSNQTSI